MWVCTILFRHRFWHVDYSCRDCISFHLFWWCHCRLHSLSFLLLFPWMIDFHGRHATDLFLLHNGRVSCLLGSTYLLWVRTSDLCLSSCFSRKLETGLYNVLFRCPYSLMLVIGWFILNLKVEINAADFLMLSFGYDGLALLNSFSDKDISDRRWLMPLVREYRWRVVGLCTYVRGCCWFHVGPVVWMWLSSD